MALPQRPPRTRRGRAKKSIKEGVNVEKVVDKAQAQGVGKAVATARVVQSEFDHSKGNRKKNQASWKTGTQAKRMAYAKKVETMGIKTIDQLEQVKGRQIKSRPNSVQAYASALALPEIYAKGKKVPSQIINRSASVGLVVEQVVPPLGASGIVNYANGSINNFPPGLIMFKSRTCLSGPLEVLTEWSAPQNAIWTGVVSKQSSTYGIFNVGDDSGGLDSASENMIIPQGNCNLKFRLITDTSSDPAYLIPPFKNYDNEQNEFYGHSVNLTGGQITVTLVLESNPASRITSGLALQIVQSSGIVAAINADIPTSGNVVFTYTPTAGDFRGDRMIGFRIANNSATTLFIPCLSSFEVAMSLSTSAATPQLTFQPVNFPNYSKFVGLYSKYRVVAQSILTTFIGGQGFNDSGGRVFGILSTGGGPITCDGNDKNSLLWTQTGIVSTDGGYSGPSDKGMYQFWLPSDTQDTNFRKLSDFAQSEFDRQMMGICVIGLSLANTVPAIQFKVRMFIQYEVTTNLQFVPTTPTVVSPGLLTAALKLIQDNKMGTCSENDWHTAIFDFVKGAADTFAYATPKVVEGVKSALPLLSLLGLMV